EELVVMSRYGIPTGHRGRAVILLAPRVRVSDASAADHVVLPLGEVGSFLEAQRRAGGSVDLMVRVGLRMAARHYPRWAHGRLKRAIEELRWQQRLPDAEGAACSRTIRV